MQAIRSFTLLPLFEASLVAVRVGADFWSVVWYFQWIRDPDFNS